MKRYWAGKMLVFFVGFVLLAGFAVMLLWNALIPSIFDVAPITFIQALGLLILARILVGGRGIFGGHRGMWRKRWESRMAKMSPEQRKRWKEEMGYMCWGDTGDTREGHADHRGPMGAKTD